MFDDVIKKNVKERKIIQKKWMFARKKSEKRQ